MGSSAFITGSLTFSRCTLGDARPRTSHGMYRHTSDSEGTQLIST